MIAMIVSGGIKVAIGSLAIAGLAALLLVALIATPLKAPPELHSISAARGTVDLSDLARVRAVPGARRQRARLPPLRGKRPGDGTRGDRDPWLVRIERRHHPRAVAGLRASRRRDLGGGYSRPRQFGHARRHRLSRPARGRPCRSRRGRAQDGAERRADPGRPLLRRRLCAAGGGLADPEPVRSHRVAGALSRLRRADHAAEFRRLGQRRHPAHHRPDGAARRRHHLLRGAAGARLCGAAEFREESGRDLQRPPDAQFRGQPRFPKRSRQRNPANHADLGRR